MLRSLTTQLSIGAAMLAFGASTASGAILTRTFTINTANIVDLYSGIFDSPLLSCGPAAPDAQECAFFGGYLPLARRIAISPTGTGTGTINVNYDSVTGEITQVNALHIKLPPLTLVITGVLGSTTVVVNPTYPASGFGPGTTPPPQAYYDSLFIEAGTPTLGRDLDGAHPLALLGLGTADPDQGVAVGQPAVFQHSSPFNRDVPDAAVLADVVDSCFDTGGAAVCALIAFGQIHLDGYRYRIEGTIGCNLSSNPLVLKTQTLDSSIYRVNFTVAADTDCDGVDDPADNCPNVANANQADFDNDGRGNACDNCRNVANNTGAGAQIDADNDGFGNRCDGDLNGNNVTNAQDYILFRQQLGQTNTPPAYNSADLNANGVVNSQDYIIFRGLLGAAPGPGAGL